GSVKSDGRHSSAPFKPSTKHLNHEVREAHEEEMDMTTRRWSFRSQLPARTISITWPPRTTDHFI
ncbi:hypothetical protein C2E31_20380, partial [Rhodopirellula baltica]